MPKQSTADRLAADLVEWVERRSTELAEAILGSPLAPQVERPPTREALDYFRRYLYLPDGSPFPAGRDYLLRGGPVNPLTGQPSAFAGYGPDGFETIALAVAKGV